MGTIETISDFYDLEKVENVNYEEGSCAKISDFYNDFVEKKLPKKDIVLAWNELLKNYLERPDALYFIRKYESNKTKGRWDNRRGCIVNFDGSASLVYSSNFLAHDIYLMAYNDFCPTLKNFVCMVNRKKLRNTIGNDIERRISAFPGNNKTINCYLAHIIAVNDDCYYRPRSDKYEKVSKDEASKKLYPLGKEEDWTDRYQGKKLKYKQKIHPNKLEPDDVDILKAHSMRLLNPMNYFPTPLTKNCKHNIVGLKKNIGEYEKITQYVMQRYKDRYGEENFNEFISYARFKPIKEPIVDEEEQIDFEYNKDWNIEDKKYWVNADNKTYASSSEILSRIDFLADYKQYIQNLDKRNMSNNYVLAIRKVLAYEDKTLEELKNNIDGYLISYDINGCNFERNMDDDIINALKKYKEFLEEKEKLF